MTEKSHSLNYNQLLLVVIGAFSVAVFILDIFIPLGASGSMVYVLFVMATYWKGQNMTLGSGVVGTIFIIFGFIFSVSTEYIVLSGINHVVAIIVMWATVWFVNNYKASLLQVRRNYRVLFQAANDEILVFLLDEKHQPKPFLEINDTACNILGYSRDELLQKSIFDITVAEEKELNWLIENVIEHGQMVHKSQHLTKKGEIIPVELSIRPFSYDGRLAIIIVGRDLRERRKLEQEILEVSEQERQRIGRDMHDDLGQLLTVATMTAQMLEHDLKSKDAEDAKKMHELANLIKTTAERSRTLSHGLVPFNVEKNGLDNALKDLADDISKMYDIDVCYTGDHNLLIKNKSMVVHIYRIAQEAINNAVKHGKATSIEVELSSAGDYISLHVKDNGSGFHEPGATSEGIGIRTMNFRANMIGGDLKISSEKGKGTEIICEIPKVNLR
ncbi:MAG: PAS domain-containing sensor histidine kinase [Balneolaceae bacterium]